MHGYARPLFHVHFFFRPEMEPSEHHHMLCREISHPSATVSQLYGSAVTSLTSCRWTAPAFTSLRSSATWEATRVGACPARLLPSHSIAQPSYFTFTSSESHRELSVNLTHCPPGTTISNEDGARREAHPGPSCRQMVVRSLRRRGNAGLRPMQEREVLHAGMSAGGLVSVRFDPRVWKFADI